MGFGLPDWVIYAVSGGVVALGLALFIWGIRWDRARGRWRCPSCWHDMATQALRGHFVCPECGVDAEHPRRLLRTRRNRWLVAMGCLMMVGAAALTQWPAIRRDGWAGWAPTTVLILFVPSVDVANDPVETELTRRIWTNGGSVFGEPPRGMNLWGWQRRLLASMSSRAIASQSGPGRRFGLTLLRGLGPDAVPATEPLRAILKSSKDEYELLLATSVAERMGRQAAPCLPELTQLVGRWREEESFVNSAIEAVGNIGPAAGSAVPILTEIVEAYLNGERQRWREEPSIDAVRALEKLGSCAASAVASVQKLALMPEYPGRPDAIRAMIAIDPANESSRKVVIDLMRDSEIGVREACVVAARRDRSLLGEVVSSLRESLSSADADQRMKAARALAMLGRDAQSATATLCVAARDSDPAVRMFIVRALGELRDGSGVAESLRLATQDEDPMIQSLAREAMAAAGEKD